MIVGYARVSSADQNLEVQLEQLKGAGCNKIFSEKMSGKSAENRVEFQKAIAFAREGDVFIVTRLDRAARSMSDLVRLIPALQQKGVQFKCSLPLHSFNIGSSFFVEEANATPVELLVRAHHSCGQFG